MRMQVAAIIAAAGSSSRLGQPKQLHMYEGETLLQRAIRLASTAGAAPIFVVLGANREQIEQQVEFGSARVVYNPAWQEGLGSSIRAGVAAVQAYDGNFSGVLLLICDQPRLTRAHLDVMIEKFRTSQGQAAVASQYGGVRGIPAIFPCVALPELLALAGDKGARGLLQQAAWPVIEVRFEGGEIDIDRPADLVNLTDQTT